MTLERFAPVIRPPSIDEAILMLIRLAIREDLGELPPDPRAIDRSVEITFPMTLKGESKIVTRTEGTIAGGFLAETILKHYAPDLQYQQEILDGHTVMAGQCIATISGSLSSILSAERVVLNFLSRLSGIATLTREYVNAAGNGPNGNKPVICDTRKTTPGWRSLEKYAVRCGGGVNHRMGLYDGVMLKDNHLAALRNQHTVEENLAELTARIRQKLPRHITLWLEVDSLAQLAEALPAGGADIILLDNMNVPDIQLAVSMRNAIGSGGRPLLEASGGITLTNIAAVTGTGVERISVGAMTHSARWLDLSMEFS